MAQLRILVAFPAGIPNAPRSTPRVAWTSTWCRDRSPAHFCPRRRPARRRIPCFSTRTQSLCDFGSRGVAPVSACAFLVGIGFGKPDPDGNAGTFGTAIRCTRAVVVSIGAAKGFSELRLWLGARRRFGHLYRWRSGGWTRCERLGARFHSLADSRGTPCSGAIGAICA